jgi:signal transduction histidine kinase
MQSEIVKAKHKSLTLMQKLTMLVAIPMVCELVFVGSLALLLYGAQEDAKRVEAAKQTEVVSSDINQTIYKLECMAFIYASKKDPALRGLYEATKEGFDDKLERLRRDCQGNTEATLSAERVDVLAKRLVDHLDLLIESSKTSFETFLGTASKIGWVNHVIISETSNIRAIEDRIHPHATSSTNWQAVIYGVLTTGLVLSFIICAMALRFFHLDLLQRITTIMRNTEAIAKRQPLIESVSGTDELASLDKFVHNTDASLRQLENDRQEFFSMLTHDMRAPLTQIQFAVCLVADETYDALPAKSKDMLQSIVPEITKLNRLVEDLLTANKLDFEPLKLSIEPIQAKQLLFEVRDAMQTEANSRNRSIKVIADDSEVLADPFQTGRVLTNLCANALRFAPAGSEIELRCQAVGETVVFEVADKGPGIPPELADQVFDRYRQAKDGSKTGGFGLGLYIAKSIVVAQGGQISFENRTGNETGCVFRFTLSAALDEVIS